MSDPNDRDAQQDAWEHATRFRRYAPEGALLCRDDLPEATYPLRRDAKPRAVWPEGLTHLPDGQWPLGMPVPKDSP